MVYNDKKKYQKKLYDKKRYQKNKNKILFRTKIYRLNNKEKIKFQKKKSYNRHRDYYINYNHTYRKNHKKYYKQYIKKYRKKPEIKLKYRNYVINRYKKDKIFKIKSNLRTRLRFAFETYGNGKKKHISKYGIDFYKIIEYLKPFPKDLSRYHIDHIRPLCTFNFTKEEEIKEAFRPENHQWLLAEENLRKNGKWEK